MGKVHFNNATEHKYLAGKQIIRNSDLLKLCNILLTEAISASKENEIWIAQFAA